MWPDQNCIVALSPSKSEGTSTRPIQRRTQLLSITLESVQAPLSRPSFPCWEGRDKAVWLKKPIWPRINVRTSRNDLFCSANIILVWGGVGVCDSVAAICHTTRTPRVQPKKFLFKPTPVAGGGLFLQCPLLPCQHLDCINPKSILS